ncbi:MAG: zinc-binding dehydrogenase, partial [Acidimicrobiia bacterium]|nr:zinc-binding dehydrogenase [Acidimicrobiia bacterium]
IPGTGAAVGPLRLADIDPPVLPGPDWHEVRPRLTGICGSDLATVEGRSSRYFEPFVSFPFVPGHEVVGELADGGRVALEPVLGAEARGESPAFEGAAPGDGDDYGYLVGGSIDDGIQVGFCASTGGGWGRQLVAHRSQLHPVPDSLSDEHAVMLEPAAGGVHAAFKAQVLEGATVVVLGAGTMGLCSIAGLRAHTSPGHLLVAAKYPRQRELALALGADQVVAPDEVVRAVRRLTGCRMLGDDLSGGADVTIDCVGSARSIREAIGLTRPRGRVVLVGMPGTTRLDLTGLWHRETELVGAYTYGSESLPDGTVTTDFALALDLVSTAGLDRLVSAHYPLDRWREAIAHAAEAGPRGAIKVVFDQR